MSAEDISGRNHTRLPHHVDRGGVRLAGILPWDLEAEAIKFRAENGIRPPPEEVRSDVKPLAEARWFVGRPG